ncbi:MAG: M24 family metallopeptidase [Proteobacteria bacterium]|nr:M24 family metallopeptidase [Pseudomonadota bacterium]
MKIYGIPVTEYKNRRDNLLKSMPDKSVMILPSNYNSFSNLSPYRQDSNFIYFSGYEHDKSYLLFYKNSKQIMSILITEENDPVMELWVGKRPDLSEVKKNYLFDDVLPLKKFDDLLSRLLPGVENLLLHLPHEDNNILGAERVLAKRLTEKYPHLNIIQAIDYIAPLRRKKSKNEIAQITKAIEITKKGILKAAKEINPGKNEYKVQAALEFGFMYNGSKNNAFQPIIASGVNSTTLHYEENNSVIPENSVILFDVGSEYNYYASDISRTFPTSGKYTKKAKSLYQAVLNTQKAVIEEMKPGKTFRELNALTRKLLAKEMKKLGYIKEESEISKYYYHSVSHPIGLDVHDIMSSPKLVEGDVISCEPGLYVKEDKIGIRIEDDILITKKGAKVLSGIIPKEIKDIENLY